MPYTVFIDPVDCGKAVLIGIKDGGLLLFDTIHNEEYDRTWDIEYCKPYLRPISSMTEEEKIDYQAFFDYNGVEYPEEYIDWLNAHHFDYRGLIPMGLALEAPNDMYRKGE